MSPYQQYSIIHNCVRFISYFITKFYLFQELIVDK